MDWMPSISAIAMMALGFGLLCLAMLLTLATLWRYLSLGFRLGLLHAGDRLRKYIVATIRMYFRRLMRYGHTILSTTIAVIFSLVIWVTLAASFTFTAYWRFSIAVLTTLPVAFLLAAWWVRGPAAVRHRFDFACTFFDQPLPS
jgi:hypothetical protein